MSWRRTRRSDIPWTFTARAADRGRITTRITRIGRTPPTGADRAAVIAAQQGWRLVYASLDQNHQQVAHAGNNGNDESTLEGNDHFSDRPACALFAHDERKIACLSIRGTVTIQDVVTDIRATPVPFPQQDEEGEGEDRSSRDIGITTVEDFILVLQKWVRRVGITLMASVALSEDRNVWDFAPTYKRSN